MVPKLYKLYDGNPDQVEFILVNDEALANMVADLLDTIDLILCPAGESRTIHIEVVEMTDEELANLPEADW